MLSKPENGWTVFSLGDFRAEVSYLVDIPFDWLISCKNALKHNIPLSFFLELEGETCLVTSYGSDTHIIINRRDDGYPRHRCGKQSFQRFIHLFGTYGVEYHIR